ncbi:hypothetical protein [Streptomyces sp. NBC_00079]|uniref:hypothetical protein n=1 Tax=Streptomyces sp. NBC_00079 TaxID=2975644 RepID=UPI00324C6627
MTDSEHLDPGASQPVNIPADVARDFADTWCGVLTADIAARLNCEEVDVLADLLRALGAEQAADEWIDAHAVDDEPGDAHYQEGQTDEAWVSADAYRWSPDLACIDDEAF